MSRPVILYVPGAWHSPDAFDKVIALLSAKRFPSRKIHLPSVDRSPAVSSIEPDVEAIRSVALSEMQQGHDICVVCHSYSGVPTSQALRGLGRPQTAGGGRVSAIIYIAACLLFEGVSLSGANTAHGGAVQSDAYKLPDDGNLLLNKDVNTAHGFYNDLSLEEAAYWVSKLGTHSAVTLDLPANYAAWKDIPSWYLLCMQDKTIMPETQRAFVKKAREYLDEAGGPGTGAHRLRMEEIDAGHSPFLSRPERTAAFIEKAATSDLN
ncbi:hypothetical protein EPUS_02742 [Endocarpon pusillum Z07020]|uniref:AB hydrolase-1 domain-containing protein n=1 Tax=Endocarpon pusillum (strain Z07020 / HMAS-L-300199) TaxID=1263415 RepID=U1G9B9_ENDPU|nr:uncharacterized protein EPUS_02742 [Endocarpon pusillum Z07020]ERF68286.1 hypothetical protein EPUS_02742 [Endocarpon pusillum Z07020]